MPNARAENLHRFDSAALQLATFAGAVAALRATLITLAERIERGEADDLAAQLPRELGYYFWAECSLEISPEPQQAIQTAARTPFPQAKGSATDPLSSGETKCPA